MSLVTSAEHDYSPLIVGLKLRLFVRSSTSVFTWWKFALGIQRLLRPASQSKDPRICIDHFPLALCPIVHCQPVNVIVHVHVCFTLLHVEVKIDR